MRTLNQTPTAQPPSFSLFKTDELPVFLSPEGTTTPKSEDIEHCTVLLQKLISSQPELMKKTELLFGEVKEKDYSKGIGYYNSKNLILLEYLIQLQFYQLFKINGEDLTSGQGLQLYKRLAYLKTLLTKLGPVQKKLEYQKNKLLKYSDVVNVQPEKANVHDQEESSSKNRSFQEGQSNEEGDLSQEEGSEGQKRIEEERQEEDALAYQPRPQALLKIKQTKKEAIQSEGKYVAPKMSAVLSREDKRRRKEQIQEQRKKVHLIRKYRNDLQDDEQARETGVGSYLSEKIKQKFREKTSMEEQNFMRLPETKKERFWKKSMIRQSERNNPLLDELKDIEKIKQIFAEKQMEAPLPGQNLKRKGEVHTAKAGKKKVKRNHE